MSYHQRIGVNQALPNPSMGDREENSTLVASYRFGEVEAVKLTLETHSHAILPIEGKKGYQLVNMYVRPGREDFIEEQRLKRLLENAETQKNDIQSQYSKVQSENAKDRVQFFEKIALGAGATIAGLVSAIGIHGATQKIIRGALCLRVSFVLLAVALAGAVYRNWRYPYYLLRVINESELRAHLKIQELKGEYFSKFETFSMQTGEPISPDWGEKAADSNHALKSKIDEHRKKAKNIWTEIRTIENVTLVSSILAMVGLVALACLNI